MLESQCDGAPLDLWVGHWLSGQRFSATDVDCTITVMLKILDGKCKMKPLEKQVMAALYRQLRTRTGELMGHDLHEFIRTVSACLTEAHKDRVYEQRVLAETRLSRPVMKAFKARIRAQGLFAMPASLTRQIEELDDAD